MPYTAVGGVTIASHHFVHYTRWTDTISWPLLMTSGVLPRTLQTALSDMYGASQGTSFEPQAAMTLPKALGVLSSSSGINVLPVYSSDQLGPDLSLIPFKNVTIWEQAHLVFSKAEVMRQVRVSKLLAIWDYEGKLKSSSWSRAQSLQILKAQLSVPPAKMLQCFAQLVFDAVLLKVGGVHFGNIDDLASGSLPGFTRDVPVSPFEEKVMTQLAAAQVDDAKVDLAAWSPPQETEEEAKAQAILQQFALCWWAHNLKQEAMGRWNWNSRDPKDSAAIQHYIYQACTSLYWHWHCGVRLFFWRFLLVFQEQVRDGTPFYHIAPCPVGHAHNMPSPQGKLRLSAERKVFNFSTGISLRGASPISLRNISPS